MEVQQHQAHVAAALDSEDQRLIARQVFKYQSNQIQGVLHVPVVLMLMLYPTVLGFCLAMRLGRFNLMVPTPHLNTTPASAAELGTKKDMWKTDDLGDTFLIFFTFALISAVHLYLVSFLVLRGPDGGAKMSDKMQWVAPVIFWGATTIYFLHFIKMARYGPSMGEWIAAAVSSGVIFCTTIWMLIVQDWATNMECRMGLLSWSCA